MEPRSPCYVISAAHAGLGRVPADLLGDRTTQSFSETAWAWPSLRLLIARLIARDHGLVHARAWIWALR